VCNTRFLRGVLAQGLVLLLSAVSLPSHETPSALGMWAPPGAETNCLLPGVSTGDCSDFQPSAILRYRDVFEGLPPEAPASDVDGRARERTRIGLSFRYSRGPEMFGISTRTTCRELPDPNLGSSSAARTPFLAPAPSFALGLSESARGLDDYISFSVNRGGNDLRVARDAKGCSVGSAAWGNGCEVHLYTAGDPPLSASLLTSSREGWGLTASSSGVFLDSDNCENAHDGGNMWAGIALSRTF